MPWIHKDVAWHLINVILTLPNFFSRVSILLQECHGVKEASCHGINEIHGRVINIYLDAMGQERLAQCAVAKEISKAMASTAPTNGWRGQAALYPRLVDAVPFPIRAGTAGALDEL